MATDAFSRFLFRLDALHQGRKGGRAFALDDARLGGHTVRLVHQVVLDGGHDPGADPERDRGNTEEHDSDGRRVGAAALRPFATMLFAASVRSVLMQARAHDTRSVIGALETAVNGILPLYPKGREASLFA